MGIKLFNKGKRIIEHGGVQLHPEKFGVYTPEAAKKLKALYPSELISLDDELERFEAKDNDVAVADTAEDSESEGESENESDGDGEEDAPSRKGRKKKQ